jgi:uncharacterized RDD family membrane protein YckC
MSEPPASVPPPGYVAAPPPSSPPDELLTGAPVDRGLLGEDRRKLDRRRWRASAIDNLLVGIVTVPLYLRYGANLGTWTLAVALSLAYHFSFDVTSGQTPGKRRAKLRVVMADGSPVTERAASARSVLRLVDYNVGLIVYLCSGRKRRRTGDYAAGTIVCDVARVGTYSRPFNRHDVGYPAAWMVIGLVVCALTATGHMPWSYRVRADRICAQANQFVQARAGTLSFADMVAVGRQEEAYLATLPVPRNWRGRHQELLRRLQAETDAANAILMSGVTTVAPGQLAALQSLAQNDELALAHMGYRDCAGATHTGTLS